jgi:hypothetical protein
MEREATEYQMKLSELATEVLKEYNALGDAEGLPKLWRVVASSAADGGVDGGWPPRRYR